MDASYTLDTIDTVAANLLSAYPDSRVFAFYGAMGAGKTTLIKAICKHLGVVNTVNSPTFSLVNAYHTHSGEEVYHFDFYRIKKLSEVYDIGYEEYFYSGNYCFIEWPELVEGLLVEGCVRVRITGTDTNRNLKVNA